jgi:hypothetical protein
MQFIGAVGLLFLLGTPWVFSIFGAITTTKSADAPLSLLDGILEVYYCEYFTLGLFTN